MLTFRLAGDMGAVEKFIHALAPEIPFCPSLGDLKTTLSHPESTSHRELSPSQRKQLGIHSGNHTSFCRNRTSERNLCPR